MVIKTGLIDIALPILSVGEGGWGTRYISPLNSLTKVGTKVHKNISRSLCVRDYTLSNTCSIGLPVHPAKCFPPERKKMSVHTVLILILRLIQLSRRN